RAELARWGGEPLAAGVGGDPYQPAEETYRLMPGVVAALAEAGVPATVGTRSAVVLLEEGALPGEAEGGARAMALVVEGARRGGGGGTGCGGGGIRGLGEAGAAGGRARPGRVGAVGGAGVDCRVLMGPGLPLLTDGSDQLEAPVRRIARAGVREVEPVVLRLPAGTREWVGGWLEAAHPQLGGRYAELFGRDGLPSPAYEGRILGQIGELCRVFGLRCGPGEAVPRRPRFGQLSLV